MYLDGRAWGRPVRGCDREDERVRDGGWGHRCIMQLPCGNREDVARARAGWPGWGRRRRARAGACFAVLAPSSGAARHLRSEEHTYELQSLMRISYAVFCLKKHTTN